MLSRRRFLKLTGAVLASVSVPTLGKVEKYPDFDPNEQYGDYVYITETDYRSVRAAKTILVKQIRAFIPSKYCNKQYIKFIEKPPGFGGTADPLNQVGSVGWKYIPKAKS